jgi:hypothetical protein
LGLVVYPGLAALNALCEIGVRVTEPWCVWFEKDLPAGPDPDGPVDGDPGADERSEA